jgi:zinc protease
VSTGPLRSLPPLGPARRPPLPRVSERCLANGLRVAVVRRPAVPLVHLRLRIPSGVRRAQDLARSGLLARTLLLGTDGRSEEQIADTLMAIGGGLRVDSDADGMTVAGESLSHELPTLLDLLGDVLTSAAYPRRIVEREMGRYADHVTLSASDPSSAAADAWARRRYGDHPYGRRFARADEVRAIAPGSLRAQHRRRVVPDGAVLVVVGDVRPARVLDGVEQRLSGWEAGVSGTRVPRVPEQERVPLLLVDRPGSVQASIRLGGDAPAMTDPAYPATQVADAIFTGLFMSRMTANLREDKGYTYGAFSTYRMQRGGPYLAVGFDAATEVTAPAVVETIHELGRMVTLPPDPSEVSAAAQFLTGGSLLRTAGQSGLADAMVSLLDRGLDATWLRDHPARLAAVTREEVLDAARNVLSPTRVVWTILGDAAALQGPLSDVAEVTTVAGP